jgi:hypothetical protein
VTDPFREPGQIEENQEERLRWYFEEFLFFPALGKEKSKRATGSIKDYGETLFEQVMGGRKVYAEWQELSRGLDNLRIRIDSPETAFQALHWEAMKDPDQPHALCLRGVEFIRASGKPTAPGQVKTSSTLNLLIVAARPRGERDVAYRTITRPVVETVEKNRTRVAFHLLRPPTFRQLKEHLDSRKGHYHILHLDVHGSVLTFEQYRSIMASGDGSGSVEPPGSGRRKVEQFDGTRAFVSLLGERGGTDLVLADDLAELLNAAHVPVCFLNACQSAMATHSPGNEENRAQ